MVGLNMFPPSPLEEDLGYGEPPKSPKRKSTTQAAGLAGLAPSYVDVTALQERPSFTVPELKVPSMGAEPPTSAPTPTPAAPTQLPPYIAYSESAKKFFIGGQEVDALDPLAVNEAVSFLDAPSTPAPAKTATDWQPIPRSGFLAFRDALARPRGFGEKVALGAQEVAASTVAGVGRAVELAGAPETGQAIAGFAEEYIGPSEQEQRRSALIAEEQGLLANIWDAAVQGGIPSLGTTAAAGATGFALAGPPGAAAGILGSIFFPELSSSYDAAVQGGYDVNDPNVKAEILTATGVKTAVQSVFPAVVYRGLSRAFKQTAESAMAPAVTKALTGRARAGAIGGAALTGALQEGTAEGLATLIDSVAFDPEFRAKLTPDDWKAIGPYVAEKYGEDILISFGAGALVAGPISAGTKTLETRKPADLLKRGPEAAAPPSEAEPEVPGPPAPSVGPPELQGPPVPPASQPTPLPAATPPIVPAATPTPPPAATQPIPPPEPGQLPGTYYQGRNPIPVAATPGMQPTPPPAATQPAPAATPTPPPTATQPTPPPAPPTATQPTPPPAATQFSVEEAKTRIATAQTGQPFAATLIRGQGAAQSPYNPLGAQVPILGQGRYTTYDEEYASIFGPDIAQVEVSLKNPLVVANDTQWRALTKRAGWQFPNPFGLPPDRVTKEIEALRKLLVDEGYDGVVVRVPEFESEGKTLQNVFGADQVIEFNEAATQPTPAATPPPAATQPIPPPAAAQPAPAPAPATPQGPVAVFENMAFFGKPEPELANYAYNLLRAVGLENTKVLFGSLQDTKELAAADPATWAPQLGTDPGLANTIRQSARRRAKEKITKRNGGMAISWSKAGGGYEDTHLVRYNRSWSRQERLETVAHEVGHVVEVTAFEDATPAEKAAIQQAHLDHLKKADPKTYQEFLETFYPPAFAQRQIGVQSEKVLSTEASKIQDAYDRSFEEWFANQVARWAVSQRAPLTIVERFFKRIGDAYKKLFTRAKASGYVAPSMKAFLDARVPANFTIEEIGLPQFQPQQRPLRTQKAITRAAEVREVPEGRQPERVETGEGRLPTEAGRGDLPVEGRQVEEEVTEPTTREMRLPEPRPAEWFDFTQNLKTNPIPSRTIAGGLRVEVKPGNGTLTYTVHKGAPRIDEESGFDESQIGSFYLRTDVTPDGFAVSVQNMTIDPEYQRQGVATAVFDLIENDIAPVGVRLVPPPPETLSEDGRAFWEARDPEALAARGQPDIGVPIIREMRLPEVEPQAEPEPTIQDSDERIKAYVKRNVPVAFQSASERIAINLRDMSLKAGYGISYGNWLTTFYKKLLPATGAYFTAMQLQQSKAHEQMAEGTAILKEANALDVKVRKALNEVGEWMTENQKWGYQPTWRVKKTRDAAGNEVVTPLPPVDIDPEAKAKWDALKVSSPKAAEILDNMFKYSYDLYTAYRAAIAADIRGELSGPDFNRLSDEEKQARRDDTQRRLKLVDLKFRPLEGPYLPMVRDGKYIVAFKSADYQALEKIKPEERTPEQQKRFNELRSDPTHYFMDKTQTLGDAERLKDEYQAMYPTLKGEAFAAAAETQNYGRLPWVSFLRLQKTVTDQLGESSPEGKKTLEAINRLLMDMYVSQLAESSARKHALRRTKVSGYNRDMIQAFGSKIESDGHFLAALQYTRETTQAFEEIKRQASLSTEDAQKEKIQGTRKDRARAFNELLLRHVRTLTPKPSPFVGELLKANFLWTLALMPRYFIQNALQSHMVTVPFMAGKYGWRKSMGEMNQAYSDVIQAMPDWRKFFTGEIDLKELAKKKDKNGRRLISDEEIEVLVTFRRLNKINVGLIYELELQTQMAMGNEWNLYNKVIHKTGGVVQAIEIGNRVASGLAAYRLAKKYGPPKGVSATEYAAWILDTTHGDHTPLNRPRFFTDLGAPGKLILQFRGYQLLQAGHIALNLYTMFKSADPEEVQLARSILKYLMAQTAVVTGVVGIPGVSLIAYVLAAAFGEEEEPVDSERFLRSVLPDNNLVEMILKGVPAGLGVDVSAQFAYNNAFSLLPYTDLDFTSREGLGKLLIGIGGPIAGTGANFFDGMGLMVEGDYYKGTEMLLPSGLKAAMRAYREGFDTGVTRRNGDLVISADEFNTLQGIFQGLGFSPTAMMRIRRDREALYQFEQHFRNRTTQIRKDYVEARKANDYTALQQAKDEWRVLQQAKKRVGFTPSPILNLYNAPREQRKREESFQERFRGLRE